MHESKAILREVLLGAQPDTSRLRLLGRGLLFVGLLVWGLRLIAAPSEAASSVLHLVNLPFHEAGHIIFMPLGPFMQVLGGTLGQLLMPTIALFALLLSGRDAFGASVASWWLGQNFLDIAPYIGDARAGRLLLLGGVTGRQAPDFHDWHNILSRLGWLEYDHLLAGASIAAGTLIILGSLLWGGWVLCVQLRRVQAAGPAS